MARGDCGGHTESPEDRIERGLGRGQSHDQVVIVDSDDLRALVLLVAGLGRGALRTRLLPRQLLGDAGDQLRLDDREADDLVLFLELGGDLDRLVGGGQWDLMILTPSGPLALALELRLRETQGVAR